MIPRSFEVFAHAFFVVSVVSLTALGACNGTATVPAISPRAQQVRVEESDPPPGATPLGELEVMHGQGCSFTGDQGTREGAIALLREAAIQRGANYVKVTKITEPYSGHDCVHREFKIEGLSYRLAGTPSAASTMAPSSASSTPVASAPVLAAPAIASAPATSIVCEPPCSPGYACESGICRALCNPACGADQVCRTDRVCVPAPKDSSGR